MSKNNIFIGTSGWSYKHWKDIFYPNDLKPTQWLNFYAKKFITVEINSSFYRLPDKKSFEKWYSDTPKNFIFSVKVSRYITHIKRLKQIKDSWKKFLAHSKPLKNKLAIFLLQFPPNFQHTTDSFKDLKLFLKMATTQNLACEFRNATWDNDNVRELFKNYKAGLVIADSSRYPKINKVTTDIVYYRMHGPEGLFSSDYPKSNLAKLAQEIRKLIEEEKKIYVYFNNDVNGYALKNADELRTLLGV